jgi:drug/metabolite transporter (DMT)-like permease
LTQHSASTDAPQGKYVLRLVGYLLRQPLWLLGWVAAAGGFVFQALALYNGQLAVVQPLLVTELVFALVLRRLWIHQQVAHSAWISAVVVCVALSAFLSVAVPHGGHPTPDPGEWLSALAVFGGIIGVTSALAVRGSPARRAALFGTATSLTWALMAAFLKATTDALAQFGVVGTLAHWPVYALALSAVAGTFLQQAALQVGPLSVSQPLIVVVDPFASIILGAWLFDERFTDSPIKIAVAILSFAVMAIGVIALARTAPSDLASSRPLTP